MSTKTILYLGGFELPDKNAAAQRVVANAKLIRELGFDISFIGVTKDEGDFKDTFDGFAYESLPYPMTINSWLYHIIEFVPINKVKSYHPQYVVLYNFPAIASLKILHFCHRHGIKVIHDTTEWEYAEGMKPRDLLKNADTWLRMRFCMNKMDGVIAISQFLYDYYKTKVKTILIPPMVDLNDKKWERNRELTTGETVRIVYAGNAGTKNKDRLDYIINAVSHRENIELTVVGMNKDQYVKSFGPLPYGCNNVRFMGRVPHLDAVNAVRDADFQVLIRENTLKNQAGFPTKFVESISCCTPLITTLSSNLGDYLVDGQNGFIVDEKNTLSDVITRVSQMSVEERIRMKSYCRDNNHFDYHNFINEFIKLFN